MAVFWHIAMEHLAGWETLPYDQTPSLPLQVSEGYSVVQIHNDKLNDIL